MVIRMQDCHFILRMCIFTKFLPRQDYCNTCEYQMYEIDVRAARCDIVSLKVNESTFAGNRRLKAAEHLGVHTLVYDSQVGIDVHQTF